MGAANELAVDGCHPDLTLVFELPVEEAARRAAVRNGSPDRVEAKGLAYQRRVAEGFRTIAAAEPGRVRLIDAAGTPDEVFARVLTVLRAAGLPAGTVGE